MFLLMSLMKPLGIAAQKSVGLLDIDLEKIAEGYNLVFPSNQQNVYLLDNCGDVVHVWEDESNFVPGNSVYLDSNGILYKAKRSVDVDLNDTDIAAAGAGGVIELRDWDNQLIYSRTFNNSVERAHHDISVMPNGHVLVVLWVKINRDAVIAAGRDVSSFTDVNLWSESIIEIDPINDSIVWRWDAWDHLVQDFDPVKSNFGEIEDNPQLIDINYDQSDLGGRDDWLHINSIDYNENLDQILVSVPFFNEIWVIDHSTTTLEAKSHEGGNSNMGGDLLYRWGNPATYRKGLQSNQKLFFQHDANWITDNDKSKTLISVFNNRIDSNYSAGVILEPSFDSETKAYKFEDGLFMPNDFSAIVTHPDSISLHSTGLSSFQILSNGNFLLLSGRQGTLFELTPENEVVWHYVMPYKNGHRVNYDANLNLDDNIMFKATRYPHNFGGLIDMEFSSFGPLEIGNQESPLCESIVSTSEIDENSYGNGIIVFPNPIEDFFIIKVNEEFRNSTKINRVNLYNSIGQLVDSVEIRSYNKSEIRVDMVPLKSGVYFVECESQTLKTINKVYFQK